MKRIKVTNKSYMKLDTFITNAQTLYHFKLTHRRPHGKESTEADKESTQTK